MRPLAGAILVTALTGCARGGDPAPVAEWSQQRGPIRATVRAEPARVEAGDRLTLVLEVEAPEGIDLSAPAPGETLGPFAVGAVDTAAPEGVALRRRYELDTFATGEQEIPPLEISYVDRRGDDPIEATLASEPLVITVGSALGGDEQMRDIRGAVTLPVGVPARVWWQGGAGLLLVLAALLVVWLIRSRRSDAERGPPPVPAHVWALEALERLAAQGLAGQGQFAEYYYKLSDIVRTYIERRFGLHAPERTTEEFLREARASTVLADVHKDLLAGFLRAADLVKFARHEPSVAEADDAMAAARGFVEQTRPRETRPGVNADPGAEGVAA